MMSDKKIMFIAEKELFLVRVMLKKIADSDVNCVFVPFTIDDVNSKWDDFQIIILFVDENSRPDTNVLHFLSDKMEENGCQMILICERMDEDYVKEHIAGDLIYRTFLRPVDNEEFGTCIREFFSKVDSGEFRKSILIVDDDPNYLGLVREWLKGTYKVSMANSGLQAIKWLGKNKVDLILLDHEMPVTTGPQVLEMLRSDEETKNIPVMFLTGKSDKESVMSVVSLRPEGYFLKTIGKDELLEKLREYFILHK